MKNYRVHGNGFIQVDWGEEENGMRLHVWHPDVPRQKISTPVHNHNFSFASCVIKGAIHHQEFEMHCCEFNHSASLYHLYRTEERYMQDTILIRANDYFYRLVEGYHAYVKVGETYKFKKEKYHTTTCLSPNGKAATLMQKTEVDPTVLVGVLCPAKLKPDNEFNRYAYNEDDLERMVKDVLFK